MRPSLPPDMGDNAAAQATLEARLRREQVKRVVNHSDLADVVGNPVNGQSWVYNVATGVLEPHGPAIPFSLAGSLTVSTSPPYPAPWAMVLDGCNFAISTTGSTSTTIAVYLNGVSQFTQTIASSAHTATPISGQNIAVAKNDLITVGVTTAGSGSKDLGGWVGLA